MSDISRRYDRLSTAFAARVAAVPDDGWDSPSPCADWTALDLVRHVVDSHATFVGLIDRELPAGPTVDGRPAEAFGTARRTVLALLEDPDAAGQTYEGQFGTNTFEWAVDNFLSFDLVVHGWDLARATGQDESIDPVEIARLRTEAEGWGQAARAAGAFGPALDPPAGADEQARLLAFLGRRP